MNSKNQSSTTIVSIASAVVIVVMLSSGAAFFAGSGSPSSQQNGNLAALLASVKDKSVADAVPVLQRAYPGYPVKQNTGGKNKKGTNTVWYELAENGRTINSIGVNGSGAALSS